MEIETVAPRSTQLLALYQHAVLDSTHEAEAFHVAAMISAGVLHDEYKKASDALGGHIPPWFIGCLHYREQSSLTLRAYLGNGQLIIGSGKKSSIVPVGRGPFKTFHDGAVDALKLVGFDKFSTWTAGECLERAEKWNGLGYMKRGVVNPYLFAGTSAYHSGKYVADGHYDPSAMDKQLGVACIMKSLHI